MTMHDPLIYISLSFPRIAGPEKRQVPLSEKSGEGDKR
jgi:hypothetical protein